MTKDIDKDTEGLEEPRSGKKKLILITLLVTLLSAGGAGAYLLWGDQVAPGEDGEAAEVEPVEIVDPIFVKVGPMTVNVQGRRGDRLLYTSLMVKVGDEATEKFLLTHMPDINNRMLILLSQQLADELNALEGKAIMAEKILAALEQPFSDPQPELAIQSVFFQEFIVQ